MSASCLRPLGVADAPWAARQHALLMEHSVFALFGAGFLESVYRAFARSRHAVALVYAPDGEPRGVIACTSDRRAFLADLRRLSGPRLALLAAWGFVTRGACRRLLLQAPRYLRRTRRSGTDADAEMIFITVDPACRGGGAARTLILGVLEEYRRRGVARVTVSIESGNRVIKRLLLDLGFGVIDTFTFADKPNDLLARDLEPAPARAADGSAG